MDIKSLFNNLQKEMVAKLQTNAHISHPTAKGDATELNWIEWLRSYLPKRYTVDSGFVVDHQGNLSEQIDLIIYDTQFCPFIFNKDGIKYIPSESVYAVFEVKQSLNKKNLDYACKKAQSVRVLQRTTKPIVGTERPLKPKELKPIICGLLCEKSGWSIDESSKVKQYVKAELESRLNLVCSLKSRAYVLEYSEAEATVKESAKDESLIYFFINLFVLLQNMGNPPAMDIMAYAKAIDSLKN